MRRALPAAASSRHDWTKACSGTVSPRRSRASAPRSAAQGQAGVEADRTGETSPTFQFQG